MIKQIQQVRRFHDAFSQPVYDMPHIPKKERIELRHNLLMEEVTELNFAAHEGDIVEVADGIVDCLYILFGTAHEFGLANLLPELFQNVHESNMSKLDKDGKAIFREDGKVIKSEFFTRPNLHKILFKDGTP